MKDDDDTLCYRSELEAAVKAAVEAEREACAEVCEGLGYDPEIEARCAAAIRARGQDPMPLFDDWPGGWKK
jgi:hypothetical protein